MKGYKIKDCCTHYNGSGLFNIGYAVLPCFKVAICLDCGEVTMICNSFFAWLFDIFFSLFWNGDIKARADKEYRIENGRLKLCRRWKTKNE